MRLKEILKAPWTESAQIILIISRLNFAYREWGSEHMYNHRYTWGIIH